MPTMTSETTYGTKIRVRISARPLNFYWLSSLGRRGWPAAWMTSEATTTGSRVSQCLLEVRVGQNDLVVFKTDELAVDGGLAIALPT